MRGTFGPIFCKIFMLWGAAWAGQGGMSPAKKRKTPYRMEQSMVVKLWPITKVKSMLLETLMADPAARVSRG